jgi:predicted nucleic acid-binding protein
MPAINVVSDANVVLKWFHTKDEEEVDAARALLEAHKERSIALSVLDLTIYEVGNALMRGRAGASAGQAAAVVEALIEICPPVRPSLEEMRRAAELVEHHELTLYDAAYVAVAQSRSAALVTLDRALLEAELGRRPREMVQAIASSRGADT